MGVDLARDDFTYDDAYSMIGKNPKAFGAIGRKFRNTIHAIITAFDTEPKIVKGTTDQLVFSKSKFLGLEFARNQAEPFDFEKAEEEYIPEKPKLRLRLGPKPVKKAASVNAEEDEKAVEPEQTGMTIGTALDLRSTSTRSRSTSTRSSARGAPTQAELEAQGEADLELAGFSSIMSGSRGRSKRGRSAASGVMDAMRMAPPVRDRKMLHTMRTSLNAQPNALTVTDHTSYNHMIEGDLAPVGRVHLVALGPDVGDENENHILTQLDADANMGAQNLRMRARRGPFRTSTGRSRIMGSSAHVSYRRRGYTIEITVRRGVTGTEMDVLISKLCAHRMASQEATVFLINGTRKKMGTLDRIDMEKLRSKIEKELTKRATIGILIQDSVSKGILHKGYSYSMEFQNDMKGLKGAALFAR